MISLTIVVSTKSLTLTCEPNLVKLQVLEVLSTNSIKLRRLLNWSSNCPSKSLTLLGRSERNFSRAEIVCSTIASFAQVNFPVSIVMPNFFSKPIPGPASCFSNDCCILATVASSVDLNHCHNLASSSPSFIADSP